MQLVPVLFILFFVFSCGQKQDAETRSIHKTKGSIQIDGVPDEKDWQNVSWQKIENQWLGQLEGNEDFSGRYKLLWDEEALYVFAEIKDDTLIDIHPDPLKRYWDDDCLEVFIDEDNSGGIHQYNHNAFAYHIALDGRVVDVGVDSVPIFLDHHIVSARKTEDNVSQWELKIMLYADSYIEMGDNIPRNLSSGESIGFAIAYCDNDHSAERESFIGSEYVQGEDKNRGWIDADIFGDYILK